MYRLRALNLQGRQYLKKIEQASGACIATATQAYKASQEPVSGI